MNPNPPPPPPPPQQKGKSSTATVFIILGVGFGLCCIIGILAAIAIPNFIKFQSRSKQSECKVNLKTYFTAQKSYQGEKNAWAASPEEAGWSPDATRYTYFLGGGHVVTPKGNLAAPISEGQLPPLESEPGVSEDGFTAVCAGNIDNDETLDIWSISSRDRTIGGLPVSAGTPHNDVNDVSE